jgi:hypothetical protein
MFLIIAFSYLILKKQSFFQLGAYLHFPASMMAFVRIVVLKQASEVYSVDCVWFNGLMGLIYLGLFFVTKKSETQIRV